MWNLQTIIINDRLQGDRMGRAFVVLGRGRFWQIVWHSKYDKHLHGNLFGIFIASRSYHYSVLILPTGFLQLNCLSKQLTKIKRKVIMQKMHFI